jgi:hypothetical protein
MRTNSAKPNGGGQDNLPLNQAPTKEEEIAKKKLAFEQS